jgi:phosphate transport system permease protein
LKARRVVSDRIWTVLCGLAVCIAVIPLLSILYDVILRGAPAINWTLLTALPRGPGIPGGGISNAIVGTLVLVALGSLIGIPVGILSGVYIVEYGSRRFGPIIRFVGDVLAGVPSIVTGVLVYCVVVLEFHHFSAAAGGLALGLIMIPISSNTTVEALRAVPDPIREGSLALGIRSWRTSLLVVANAKSGIATGALLSVARITGETAPLLLTALFSTLPFAGINEPIASLPIIIFEYATSPFRDWQSQAWGGALILVLIVIGINLVVRLATRNKGNPA